MNRSTIIACLKKYHDLAESTEEKKCFEEVIEIFQSKDISPCSSKKKVSKVTGATSFKIFLEKDTSQPEKYFDGEIQKEIQQHKNMMLEYWSKIDNKKKRNVYYSSNAHNSVYDIRIKELLEKDET